MTFSFCVLLLSTILVPSEKKNRQKLETLTLCDEVWVPEDKLALKFRRQGKEEDIHTGSASERTAGMLGLLLALYGIPLIYKPTGRRLGYEADFRLRSSRL